jgi:glycosyltransferase involved in cell wall biosynthesis
MKGSIAKGGLAKGGIEQHSHSDLSGRRIVFFASTTTLGGMEFSLSRIMKAARAAGAEVLCLAPKEARLRQLFSGEGHDSVRFVDWPPGPPVRRSAKPVARLFDFWAEARALSREFARLQPDLAFISILGAEPAALGACLAGVNRVLRPCLPARLMRFPRLIDDLILRTVTLWSSPLTIQISENNARGWQRMCCHPRRRTRVILNGVPGPSPAIDGAAKRRHLGVPADAFLFCVPARLSWEKGQSCLLEALGAPGDFSGSQVLICGDGLDEADLRAQSDRLGLNGIVRFLGWRDDIREIIQASDCVVVPSLMEAFSLAAADAAMEGKPVIASKVGGLPEVVLDGQTGILVPPNAPGELRAALLKVMSNRKWAAQLGRHARTRALQHLSVERMAWQYVETIEEYSHAATPVRAAEAGGEALGHE